MDTPRQYWLVKQEPGEYAWPDLVHDGKVTKVKGEMYFDSGVIERLKETVAGFLKEKKEMLPADFKNMTGLSRKYMIPLLEYLDEIRLTIRTGDKRVLRS